MLITTKRPREILDVEDTRERSKDLIDEDVIWSYPGYERKVAEAREDVIGYPTPKKHATETVHKVSVPRDLPPRDFGSFISEEGVE